MSIKKGDTVKVLTGKDAGKQGKVLKIITATNRVIVEGVNKVKKHQKPSRSLPQGGIMSMEAALHRSNVMLVCSHCKKPTRVGVKFLDNNEKVRMCKKCGEILK
ncbi:MAG: 50S ribosomal protein L24 [Syntrophomonadaceae bacterium]|jgi:large subunit ribosomal protein L24|nr:50S ribosomal protein L24 [Syntrophomonadaceae bacterium]